MHDAPPTSHIDLIPALDTKMKIYLRSQSDVMKFRGFWMSAISYQRAGNFPLWPSYPESQISEEIESSRHFSAYLEDGDLAGYFSIALTDSLIWGDKEQGSAIYIHRMCVNPNRKGSNFTSEVLFWAYQHAFSLGRNFVRMDTWGDNKRLVEYYIRCGFRYIGDRRLGIVPELPPHYSNTNLALFENLVPAETDDPRHGRYRRPPSAPAAADAGPSSA